MIKQLLLKLFRQLSFSLNSDRHSKVLYYHDLHNDELIPRTSMSTPLSVFMMHLQVFGEMGFEIVTKITKPNDQILITFDDGFRGIWDVKEILLELNVKPKIFIITNFIDKPNYLQKEEIQEMQNMGFSFGSHTRNHLELNKLNSRLLVNELKFSKSNLEEILSSNVDELAFPRGKFSHHVCKEAFEIGYQKLYSTIPKPCFGEENGECYIGRYLVQNYSRNEISLCLGGGEKYLNSWYLRKAMR
jgi:peptidoglycan/xylan/chitin deacetylase (PgdA/CDA1 family)